MSINKSLFIFTSILLYFNILSSSAQEGGMQLIKNGQFEKWRNGIPEFWKAHGISIAKERGDLGLCVKFGPLPKKGQAKNFISLKLPALKPNTVYRVDFFVQSDKIRRGMVTFTVSGCDGKNLRFSGQGGYFSHLSGYRYTRYFTVGKKVDSQKTKITFSGVYATLDAVSIMPLGGSFNGIEFSSPEKNGILKFCCGILNQTARTHTYKIECNASDFFENPLVHEAKQITLAPGKSVSFNFSFPTGNSKRYRMQLKAVRDDGYVFSETRFYEPKSYQTATRQYINLRQLKWALRMQGKNETTPDLNGIWKTLKIPAAGKIGPSAFVKFRNQYGFYPLPGPSNKPIKTDFSKDYWGFLKTNLPLPANLDGKRVIISFPTAYFQPALFVNGKLTGQTPGAVSLSADITQKLKNRDKQEIILRLASAKALYEDSGEGINFRRSLKFMPHQHNQSGIFDNPRLEIVPSIRIEKVFIDTSFRNREIQLIYVIKNDSRTSQVVFIAPEIFGRGKSVLKIKPTPVLVYGQQSMRVKIVKKWENPVFWEPGKPYLYRLSTNLLPGSKKSIDPLPGQAPLDVQNERFGFKEIWTKGRQVFINGKVLKMKTMLSSPHPAYTRIPNNYESSWREYEVSARAGMFFHTNHTPLKDFYHNDIADELGILQRPKLSLNMVFNDWRLTFNDTSEFWRTSADFSRATVERLYNHPSFAWLTMENETFLCGAGDRFPQLFDRYRDMVEIVKGVKPGLLVSFDGSDPGGISDIWNLHYPMKYQRWMPLQKSWNPPIFEDGQWVPLQLFPGSGLANRTKPLVFGEDFIDYPEMPGSLSFLSDEDIYEAFSLRRQWCGNISALLRGMDRLHQPFVRSYRRAGATIITAWPLIDRAFTKDLASEAVFIDEPWRNVKPGENFSVTVRIHHDMLEKVNANLDWQYFDSKGKEIMSGSKKMKLVPGDMRTFKVKLNNPKGNVNSSAFLNLQLRSGKRILATRKTVFNIINVAVYPKTIPVLYDPVGNTAKVFKTNKIPFKKGNSPRQNTVFIIAKNALVNNPSFPGEKIVNFVKNGGRVIVMSQDGRIPEWLPVKLTPQFGAVSFAGFPRAPLHPVLKGIGKESIRFWRNNGHVTSYADYWKPAGSNLISIIDTGNVGGFLTTALGELSIGKGSILLSQLAITDNLGKDPVAGKILANIIAYSTQPRYRALNSGIEVVGEKVDDTPLKKAGIKLVAKSNIIFTDGSTDNPATIRRVLSRVKKGATLWLHGLNPESAKIWEQAGIKGLKLVKDPRKYLYKVNSDPLLAGISNTDFHWVGMALAPMPGEYAAKGLADVCEYRMVLPRMKELIENGALATFPMGEGTILIDNLCWSSHLRDLPTKTRRIASLIATNLGVIVEPTPTSRAYSIKKTAKFASVSLGNAANLALNKNLKSGNFAGIPFTIKNNTDGAVIVGSSILTERMPKLKNISDLVPVNQKCQSIYFLATAYDPFEAGVGYGSGELIGGIDLKYEDGLTERQELRHKVHVLNFFESMGDLREGKLVWEGNTPFAIWLDKLTRWEGHRWIQREHANRLYLVRWINPNPDKTIKSLRLFSTNKHLLPILLGATLQQ